MVLSQASCARLSASLCLFFLWLGLESKHFADSLEILCIEIKL